MRAFEPVGLLTTAGLLNGLGSAGLLGAATTLLTGLGSEGMLVTKGPLRGGSVAGLSGGKAALALQWSAAGACMSCMQIVACLTSGQHVSACTSHALHLHDSAT